MHAFLMYLYSVELHHGSMLPISYHCGLDHLPESCFLLQQKSKWLSIYFPTHTAAVHMFVTGWRFTLPCDIRMPRRVSKPTDGPWPVWPKRPSRSNMGIHGQKSSEMWCNSSSLFLRAMIEISCRWLYSMGTFNKSHKLMSFTAAGVLEHNVRVIWDLFVSFNEPVRVVCQR